jgi:hypothetical protein
VDQGVTFRQRRAGASRESKTSQQLCLSGKLLTIQKPQFSLFFKYLHRYRKFPARPAEPSSPHVMRMIRQAAGGWPGRRRTTVRLRHERRLGCDERSKSVN